jgi:hypothetical protein
MALWSNSEAATSAPKYAPAGGLGVSANGQQLYANTTADVFVTGQTIGVFGVTPSEKIGTGNVSSFTIVASGDSATDIPTVTVTGANTTPATATVNVKVVSVSINAGGTGYAVGNTFTVTGGTGTSAVVTATTVAANGAITGLSITTAGRYSAVPVLTNLNTFTSNTGSGSGFRANLRYGIESVTPNATGFQYNYSTITATAAGNNIANSIINVELTGQEGSTKQPLAGWNLRKEGSGGRAGRVQYECLVAMGSMIGDGSDDSVMAE